MWSELKKIVEGNFGPDLLHLMLDIGLGPHMGFPENLDLKAFAEFRAKLKTIDEPVDAITIICSLLNTPQEVLALRNRLKISNFHRDLALFVLQHRDTQLPADPLRWYYFIILVAKVNLFYRHFRSLVVTTTGKTSDIRQYVEQVLLYRNLTDVLRKFREWTVPVFPVKGNAISSVCEVTS